MKTLFCFLCATGLVSGTFSQGTQADLRIVQPTRSIHSIAKATDDANRTTLSEPVHIKVLDSADAKIVTIHASVPEALESVSDRPGIFKVLRTGDLKTRLNVHYLITGTSQNGIDYDKLSGTVTIPAGESSAPILIKPVPDKALEGTEPVTLTLEQRVYIRPPPPEEDYLVGEPKSATVLIVENPVRGFPPKVDLLQPKEGDFFAERATIKIEIQTADADGYVLTVELYDGDHLIDSETRNFLIKPSPGEIEHFAFEWKDAFAGEHQLIAKAIDDSGLSSTSSPVRIMVGGETEVPVVTIMSVDNEGSDYRKENAFGKLRNIHRHSTGECEVSFSAEAGHRYKLQISTDLLAWIDLDFAVNEAGELHVLDPDATHSPVRYYRAIFAD